MIKKVSMLWVLLIVCSYGSINAQDVNPVTLQQAFSFEEFLAMVKKYHPVVAQANLKISEAEAQLLKARGAFDPKIEGGLNEKNYKGTEYYQLWDGTFKVPTWYGIDVKANYQQTTGEYLNPQNNTPEDGLFSAGVSINVLEGMLYNDRMNTVRKAKILNRQNILERDIQVNTVLANASRAYADWMLYYQNKLVFEEFLTNAQIRFQGIVTSSELGETRIIDTVETKITVDQRRLQLQQSELNLRKAQLYLSTFLWIDDVPIQLEENLTPAMEPQEVFQALDILQLLGNAENLSNHPELQVLNYQIDQYALDVKLSKNNLLPNIDVEYNFINEKIDANSAWNVQNYKAMVSVQVPLFLRKERGDLRLAQIQQENSSYELAQKSWELTNQVKSTEQEVISYQQQLKTANDVVSNNQIMVRGEVQLFDLGESSIFLVNTRENQLIDAQLKQNEIENKLNYSAVKLFENLRLNWE